MLDLQMFIFVHRVFTREHEHLFRQFLLQHATNLPLKLYVEL